MTTSLTLYTDLLGGIKSRIRQAQVKATLSANAEMILMYWDIGHMIHDRQQREGWGAAVIPRLSRDIRNDLPEEKGFSERNIKRMLRFYREYTDTLPKVPRPVAQMPSNELSTNLQQLVAKIPWGHNILLLERVKDLPTRLWYMQQTIEQGLNSIQINNRKGDTMKKYVLILLAVCCTALTACSSDQGKQQLETAQFEEKQNNREHAIKLYEEVVTKYAGSPNAKTAQDRLNALKGGK